MPKPFNLQDALNGKPVVNGSGESVVITKLAVPNTNGLGRLVSQRATDGSILAYHHENGDSDLGSVGFKLFMASTQKTVWINFYDSDRKFSSWDSKQEADDHSHPTRIGNKAHPIVIEE